MRSEIIRCDACKKEHDAQYYLPPEWITTKQRVQHGYDDEEKHFCSKFCLIKWVSEGNADTPQKALSYVEECLDDLCTVINFLHPKEAYIGPIGIESQVEIVKIVKENFKKLCEAIKVLKGDKSDKKH